MIVLLAMTPYLIDKLLAVAILVGAFAALFVRPGER